MKIYIKSLSYIFIGMFSLTLIITILHYFNIISETVANISKLVIPVLSVIVGGILMGKSALKRGWLEGIKLAAIIILLFMLITLIFGLGFSSKTIIYYLIITASSTAGGMIGINSKIKNKV